MLTRKLPYADLKDDAQIVSHLRQGRKPKESTDIKMWTETDLRLWKLCRDCWQWKPSKRPTASDLSVLLFLESSATSVRTSTAVNVSGPSGDEGQTQATQSEVSLLAHPQQVPMTVISSLATAQGYTETYMYPPRICNDPDVANDSALTVCDARTRQTRRTKRGCYTCRIRRKVRPSSAFWPMP